MGAVYCWRVWRSHNDGVVGQGDWVVQHHFLPNYSGLSNIFQRLVLGLSESIQSLFESLSRSSQSGLSLRVVRITLSVDFVATSAEVVSGEQLGRIRQQVSREFDGVGRGETKLPSGRLVSVRRPRTGFGTCNVLREGLGDDRSVTGGVDLGDDVDATLENQGINNTERIPRGGKRVSQAEKRAYLVGILDNICDLRWSITLVG